MSYEPLHHKYRPKTFAELVGQEAIATTLINAIRSERIAPAYLFTGPRGTGKTSSARILAKSLNCKKQDKPTESPCGICEVCISIASGYALDVVEIDAASNTGVDNIREIIERTQFAPAQCRYKVYIIDEVHMLSTAAFNALLKTLEEPPEHVVFVLATTDPQRVLPTIISRCQRFDFRRIPLEAMVSHLRGIAAKEIIDITLDALTLVAQVAQGGLRDAESLLDQLSLLTGQITVEQVWNLVGAVPERDLMVLMEAIASDQPQLVLDQCRHLIDKGREPLVVLQNLAGFYRDLLIAKTAPKRSDLVAVTPPTWNQLCEFADTVDISDILQGQQRLKNSEAQIKNTTQPRLWLEVTLLGLLPSALSADLVVRNEDKSHSSTAFKPAVKSSPQTSRDREVLAQRDTAAPKEVAEPSSAAQPLTRHVDRTTQPQQPSDPAARHLDTSPNGVGETQVTSPSQTSRASSPPVSTPSSTVERTDNLTTAAANPSKSAPSFASQTSNDPGDNVDQIWRRVLDHLQPRATQELLRQHCRLVSFDRSVAFIGISSEPLLKMAQTRVANIEAAFETVYKSKVKVSLQIGASEPINTPPTKQLTSPSQFEPTPEEGVTQTEANYPPPLVVQKDGEKRREQERENDVPFSRQTNNLLTTSPISDPFSSRQGANRISGTDPLGLVEPGVPAIKRDEVTFEALQSNVLPLPLDPSSMPLPPQALDWDADEVEKALGNLKQFFEGEIVDLTEDFDLGESLISEPQDVPSIATTELPNQVSDAVTDQLETELEEDAEELDFIEPGTTYYQRSSDTTNSNNSLKLLESEDFSGDDDDIPF